MIYDDGPFELIEATVIDMQAAMNAGVTTSVAITQEYLDRIAAYDRIGRGAERRGARPQLDHHHEHRGAAGGGRRRRRGAPRRGMTSLLLGVPIAVKDNYDTVDMPTTGGCGCWDENQTATDAVHGRGTPRRGRRDPRRRRASTSSRSASSRSSPPSSPPERAPSWRARTTRRRPRAARVVARGRRSRPTWPASASAPTPVARSACPPPTTSSWASVRPVGLTSRDGIIPLALSQDTGGPLARAR